MLSKFTIKSGNSLRIASLLSQMSGVRVTRDQSVITVETLPPFDDENEYGPRMDRVFNVVRGLDAEAIRDDATPEAISEGE